MKAEQIIHRIVKIVMACCFTTSILFTGIMTNVHAAEYEIVFKTGAHGTIDGEKRVSYHKVYGEVFPDEPTVTAETGYAFDGWNKELPEVGSAVSGKEVYVARYITLVDGVEYRVRYVDEQGVDIATQKVSVTERGKTIQERAKVLAGYSFDQAVKSLQVSNAEHEIVFVYTLIDERAATTNPPVVTTTQNETTNPPTTNTTPDTTNPDNTPDTPVEEQVEDNETPQGGGEEEQVEDNQTPLANLDHNQMITMMGIGGVIAIGAIIFAFAYKKRKKQA